MKITSQQFAWQKNPQFHGRAKHIGIKYHFIREQVNNGQVALRCCPTEEMVADMLTKGLSQEKFVKLRTLAGLREMDNKSVSK